MFEPPRALLVFALLMMCGIGSSATIYVSGSGSPCSHEGAYASISEAVAAASEGDEIMVCGGEYVENVVVDKSVALRGGEGGTSVVRAAIVSHPVMAIDADGVSISDFTLRDATGSFGLYSTASDGDISNIVATNNDIGFCLHSSSRNVLSSNIAHDNTDEGFRLDLGSDDNLLIGNLAYNQLYYGFYLHGSSRNRLVSNTAQNSTAWYGFFLYTGARGNELVNNSAFGNMHSGFHIYSTSDNLLEGNSAYNNSGEGFRLSSGSKNTLSGNLARHNLAEGFRLSSASDNELTGNTAFDNTRDGFLLSSSTKNLIENNAAYDNSIHGFYLHQSSDNDLISNTASWEDDGFHIFGGSKNRLESNIAHDNGNGFYLDISSGNTLESNFAYGNEEHGFLLSSCTGNDVEGNDARGNGLYGFYGYLGSGNAFESNSARDNLIGFVLSSSTANSMGGNAAEGNNAHGIYLYQSDGNGLDANLAGGNRLHGIYLYESDGCSLSGNRADANGANGIYLYLSSDCKADGNAAYGNAQDGISIYSGLDNGLSDNEAYGNSRYGVSMVRGSGNSLRGDSIYANGAGCLLESSSNASLEKTGFYGNNIDLEVRAEDRGTSLSISKAAFLNPSGGGKNQTVLSLEDFIEPHTAYSLSWAHEPAALPHPHVSFEGKYLDITTLEGAVSIDSISWHWLGSEAQGKYREKDFRVWQHDAAGWLMFGDLPDIHGKKISISGLVPGSVYGVLQNRSLPSITLTNPAPGAVLNSGAASFGWAVETSDGSALCDISINGSRANSAPINAGSGVPVSFSTGLGIEGNYAWNVTCQDSVGANSSETRGFSFDRPPLVRLQNATPAHANSSSYVLNYTAYDNLSSTLMCTLYIDGAANQTHAAVQRNVSDGFAIGGLSEGSHTLRISCIDGAGNAGDSESKTLVADFTPPAVGLLSPQDGYHSNNASVSFTFTASDALSPPPSYSLYIDGAPAQSGPGNLSASLSEGTHSWSILAKDAAGNAAMSEVRSLAIDRTPPVVRIDQPAGERHVVPAHASGAEVLFTANDSDPFLDCSLFIDGSLNRSGITAQSGIQASLAISNLAQGSHAIYISCADDAGNSKASDQIRIIVDATPPEITLLSPSDGFLGNASAVDFRFNASDSLTEIQSCSIVVDGTVRGTANAGNFTLSLAQGAHNWSVSCSDEAGNTGTSGTSDFSLDLGPPVISSLSPGDGETLLSQSALDVEFNFTATDDQSPSLNCTLFIDGRSSYANQSVPSGFPQTVSREIPPGNHHWRVECRDDAGNAAKSAERILVVRTNGSSSGGDGDDDGYGPKIAISIDEICPGDLASFEVSSGQGTLLRLIGPEGFVLDSKQANASAQARFQLYGEGLYEVKASKDSYLSGELVFYHYQCPDEGGAGGSGSEGQVGADGSGAPDANLTAKPEAGQETAPEQEGLPKAVAPPEPDAGRPAVEIDAPESAHVGDTINISVLVNGVPASVLLEIRSPSGNRTLTTDISGTARLILAEPGRHVVIVSGEGLPRVNATIEATSASFAIDAFSFPIKQNFAICTPLALILGLLLIALLMMSAYAAHERRKRRKGEYGGYRANGKGRRRIMEFFGL